MSDSVDFKPVGDSEIITTFVAGGEYKPKNRKGYKVLAGQDYIIKTDKANGTFEVVVA